MRIVFLDIDGVLNTCDGVFCGIDRSMVGELNTLVARSGASVVVSSSWRIAGLPRMQEVLAEHGFVGQVLDVTPMLGGLERGHEIQAWLDGCAAPVTSWVILDDDDDMAHLQPYLVRTNYRRGLTAADVEIALEKLGVIL